MFPLRGSRAQLFLVAPKIALHALTGFVQSSMLNLDCLRILSPSCLREPLYVINEPLSHTCGILLAHYQPWENCESNYSYSEGLNSLTEPPLREKAVQGMTSFGLVVCIFKTEASYPGEAVHQWNHWAGILSSSLERTSRLWLLSPGKKARILGSQAGIWAKSCLADQGWGTVLSRVNTDALSLHLRKLVTFSYHDHCCKNMCPLYFLTQCAILSGLEPLDYHLCLKSPWQWLDSELHLTFLALIRLRGQNGPKNNEYKMDQRSGSLLF